MDRGNHTDSQRGITGLETAIILIAFVVVAAVFSYSVLSTGIFSSQQSQQAVHSGLQEAQTTIEPRGGVILIGDPDAGEGTVTKISFTLSNAMSGVTTDFTEPVNDNGRAHESSENRVVISYLDKNNRVDNLYFTAVAVAGSYGDHLMRPGEKFHITIEHLDDALDTPLSINTRFTIEVKPPVGPVVTLQRATPPRIERVMNLL